jgi:hypothetical protein
LKESEKPYLPHSSLFGRPAHAQAYGTVGHPLPVRALVQLLSQGGYFRVFAIAGGGKRSGQEQRRIYRGKFAVPGPFAGFHIHEMIKETMHRVHLLAEKGQGFFGPSGRFGFPYPAALSAPCFAPKLGQSIV